MAAGRRGGGRGRTSPSIISWCDLILMYVIWPLLELWLVLSPLLSIGRSLLR